VRARPGRWNAASHAGIANRSAQVAPEHRIPFGRSLRTGYRRRRRRHGRGVADERFIRQSFVITASGPSVTSARISATRCGPPRRMSVGWPRRA